MPESKFKLYYFDTRGRAESIRLMLHFCGQSFEDVRFNVADWDEIKKSMPQETVPVLEVDGRRLCQSRAILRYLGRLFDLTGRNHWERAVVDSVMDLLADFYAQILPWYTARLTETDETKVAQVREEKLIPAIQTKLPYFVGYLKEARSGFYARSGVTFVDFVCCEIFDQIQSLEPELFQPFSAITDHIKTVHALPQLQNYLANRK